MISSIGSIQFIDRINQQYSSRRPSKELVKQAELFISVASNSSRFTPQWLLRFGLDLDLFLRTMLECAPTSWGQRYVASAILGCVVSEWHSVESVENLRELAVNWFGHLFWTFKSAGADGMFATNDEILQHYIREEVIRRDGNQCVVTGVYDWRRAQSHQVPKANLDYACILPRTARQGPSRDEPKCNIHRYFSMTSWDILQNYMSVTTDDEESLLGELESSANAISMELDAADSFQQFLFSLEPSPSQEPEKYIIVAYEHAITELCTIAPRSDPISLFGRGTAAASVPSPSSMFLQIHAIITQVLHMSHASSAIGRINDYLGHSHPVLHRLDFESARKTLELSQSVEKMFSSVGKEKRRAMEDDDRHPICKKFEASIRRELKRRRLT